LGQEFDRKTTAFYILTNSRSLPLTEAKKLNKEIGHKLKAVSQLKSREFVIISRSDSTLRGHFPGDRTGRNVLHTGKIITLLQP
jgi:uncharacterized protein YgbK (DUF1537 family)